jgi:hypothetical protein
MLAGRRKRGSWTPLRSALLRSSALLPAALSALSAPQACAQAVNIGKAAANFIVPDGRTKTTVSSGGAGVANITTSTVVSGNAFNSFSRFTVGRGWTANLYVPQNANTLVNVVTQAPTTSKER